MGSKTEVAQHGMGVDKHPPGDVCHSSTAPEPPLTGGCPPGGAGAEDTSEVPKVTGDLQRLMDSGHAPKP